MRTCSVELCPRGEGADVYFGTTGPPLCTFHRCEWAARNADKVSADERKHWVAEHTHEAPTGEKFTTWPRNWIIGGRR